MKTQIETTLGKLTDQQLNSLSNALDSEYYEKRIDLKNVKETGKQIVKAQFRYAWHLGFRNGIFVYTNNVCVFFEFVGEKIILVEISPNSSKVRLYRENIQLQDFIQYIKIALGNIPKAQINDYIVQNGNTTEIGGDLSVDGTAYLNNIDGGENDYVLTKVIEGSSERVEFKQAQVGTKLYAHIIRDANYGNVATIISTIESECSSWADVYRMIKDQGGWFAGVIASRAFAMDKVGQTYKIAVYTTGGTMQWVSLTTFESDNAYCMYM